MTSLSDLFGLMFPGPPPELLARFAALDLTPEALVDVRAALDGLAGEINGDYTTLSARIADLAARVAALEPPPPPPPPPPATPDTITIGPAAGTNQLQAGWVHTQQDKLPLTASQQDALRVAAPVQGQHLQGFGAQALWPVQSGPKNWASLDRMFGPPGHPEQGVMRDAKVRILYACGCPAWMKAPVAGSTITQDYPVGDTSHEFDPYQPPHRSQYVSFAVLVEEACKRYKPDMVVVWNEGKGFWSNTLHRWSYENYTEMFNIVAAYVHGVDSAIKVGGPYFVWRTLGWTEPGHQYDLIEGPWGAADTQAMDVLRYWLANQRGADFVAMDVRNSNSDYAQIDEGHTVADPTYPLATWQTNPEKGANPTYWPTTPTRSWDKLGAFMAWLRQRTDLPMWWMEFYANTRLNHANANYPNAVPASNEEMAASATEGLAAAAVAGCAGLLQWRPQGDSNGRANPLGLYDTASNETYLAPDGEQFATRFPPGAQLYNVTDTNPDIHGIATDTTLCLINPTGGPIDARYGGTVITLAAYDVRFVAR